MDDSQGNQLSNKVEQEVRKLIGELNMQIIVLKSMLELSQHAQQTPQSPRPDQPIVPPYPAQPSQPVPPSGPRPIPQEQPKPVPQQPDVNPDRSARVTNGVRINREAAR